MKIISQSEFRRNGVTVGRINVVFPAQRRMVFFERAGATFLSFPSLIFQIEYHKYLDHSGRPLFYVEQLRVGAFDEIQQTIHGPILPNICGSLFVCMGTRKIQPETTAEALAKEVIGGFWSSMFEGNPGYAWKKATRDPTWVRTTNSWPRKYTVGRFLCPDETTAIARWEERIALEQSEQIDRIRALNGGDDVPLDDRPTWKEIRNKWSSWWRSKVHENHPKV